MKKTHETYQGAFASGNRTGMARSPADGKDLASGAAAGVPQASLDARALAAARAAEARGADRAGTLPPRRAPQGLEPEQAARVQGVPGSLLIDLLGERLAAERTGARLHEALLAKVDSAGET